MSRNKKEIDVFPFEDKTLEERKIESDKLKTKFPDRLPVLIKRGSDSVQEIDKKKFLVPIDITVGQFIYIIRKRINLPPEKAIFVFVKNALPPTSALMSAIYQKYKNEDGFLYVTYSGENTFG